MTLFGKLLAVLNLIIGVGITVFATSVYTNRPGWFDPPPDAGVDKGNYPVSFKGLTEEINALGAAATTASKVWGDDYRALTTAEATRKSRQGKMAALTKRAKTARGDDEPGFYELKEDERTRLLDFDNLGEPVTVLSPLGGERKVAVGGSETLLAQFESDNAAAMTAAADSVKLRELQKQLGVEVIVMEGRFLKQLGIRDNLLNEAAALAAFEVNAGEQRDIVNLRRKQLMDRLVPFRGAPGK